MNRPPSSIAAHVSAWKAPAPLVALVASALLFGSLTGSAPAQAAQAPSPATASGASYEPSAAGATPSIPTPKVSGNKLLDTRTGKTWIPRGASVPSLAYACVQGWTPDIYFSLEGAKAMASWGMDVVRFPLNQDCWLGVDGAPEQPGSGTAAEYRERVKRWVDWSHEAGLAVILDLHWSAAPGYRAEDQQAMTDSQSVTFWEQVATAYKNDPSVMFELFNEPYNWPTPALDWPCWRDGGCELSVKNQSEWPQPDDPTFTVSGMQDLVDAVRGTGAKQPVIVNGLNYANDLTGWLQYRPTDPAKQVIAGWHNYRGQGCSDTTCWNDVVAKVAASVPVMMTEFGHEPDHPDYFVQAMKWADAHGIGYQPWAWWWGTGPEGLYTLLKNDSFEPLEGEGTLYKEYLAGLRKPANPSPYSDVPRTHRSFTEIAWMRATGIFPGRSGRFLPAKTVSRAEAAGYLYRLVKPRSFSTPKRSTYVDVKRSRSDYRVISWAAKKKVIRPASSKRFSPSRKLTRAQLAWSLYRIARPKGFKPPKRSPFSDVSKKSRYYAAIVWADRRGFLPAHGTHSLGANKSVTREQMAVSLYRFSRR